MSGLARDYLEKRDFIRMQIAAPATLVLQDGSEHQLTCLDLSSSGAQLQHSEHLAEQESGILTINSGGGQTSALQADVTVCRVQEAGPDDYRIGLTINRFL